LTFGARTQLHLYHRKTAVGGFELLFQLAIDFLQHPNAESESRHDSFVREPLPLMPLHRNNFTDSCAGLAFVTNAGLESALSGFLEDFGRATIEADLPPDAQIAFQHIARAYTATDSKLVPSTPDLFTWLRGLKVHTDQGQLENVDAALLELADVVVEFSEIDLLQRQAKQIAREIVSRVRIKVAHSTTVGPTSDEHLQRDKGIVIAELLGVLSLSTQAYEQLKAGTEKDTVKTLSRLQRYCSKHGHNNFIVQIIER
jgi:hypothetical protein